MYSVGEGSSNSLGWSQTSKEHSCCFPCVLSWLNMLNCFPSQVFWIRDHLLQDSQFRLSPFTNVCLFTGLCEALSLGNLLYCPDVYSEVSLQQLETLCHSYILYLPC